MCSCCGYIDHTLHDFHVKLNCTLYLRVRFVNKCLLFYINTQLNPTLSYLMWLLHIKIGISCHLEKLLLHVSDRFIIYWWSCRSVKSLFSYIFTVFEIWTLTPQFKSISSQLNFERVELKLWNKYLPIIKRRYTTKRVWLKYR